MADRRIPAALIRALWLDPSISSSEGARRVGLTRVNFWRRARALGLPPRRSGRIETPVPDDFDAMWLAGVSRDDLAALIGCAPITVWYIARRRGLPSRSPAARVIPLLRWRMEEAARHDREVRARRLGKGGQGHAAA